MPARSGPGRHRHRLPQAIGMAASFNAPLLQQVAEVIATEARAKHHEAARHGDRGIYKGLTFWTPNINIFRDPAGAGARKPTAKILPHRPAGHRLRQGPAGDHPKYLKAAACAKHFAVHSGPESLRHSFDARCSQKDLYETYLPAFRALVTEAKVESVMGAYNRTNGEPCCASPTLLQKILREDWGFEGHVVSDCGAIHDIHAHHKVTGSPEESAALAVKTAATSTADGCTRLWWKRWPRTHLRGGDRPGPGQATAHQVQAGPV